MQLFSIGLLVVLFVGFTLFVIYSIRDIQRIQRELREDNIRFHRVADPMMAYIKRCEETGAKGSEDGFRSFLCEQYGETQMREYLTMLQVEYAKLQR